MKKTIYILAIIIMSLAIFGLIIQIIPHQSYLTNEEIVEQTKFCESNGLGSRVIYNGFNYRVINIICDPKN